VISAELRSPMYYTDMTAAEGATVSSILYATETKNMIHGSCGILNPQQGDHPSLIFRDSRDI